MLPLQSLPKLLNPKGKTHGTATAAAAANGGVSPAREKELKEKMMVLEEQKYLVENMIERARKGRRVEEVEALKESLGELGGEIEVVKRELGDLFIG